jgi:DNA-binding GntR family transcriptional regulator
MAESLADKAYHHIRQLLLTGKLSPGTRLSNRGVAKTLEISFTPVREALGRLVSEGLLEYRDGLGVFVPVITRREIEDVYELRETIECAALEKVCGNLPKSILDEMAGLFDEMVEIGEAIQHEHGKGHDQELTDRHGQIDASFHLLLLREAGNRLAMDTVASLRRMATVISHSFDVDPWRELSRTQNEHRQLLDALRRGDAAEARAVMSDHIRNGCKLVLAAYNRHYMEKPADALRGRRRGAPALLPADRGNE